MPLFKFGRKRPAVVAEKTPFWGALMATLPTPPNAANYVAPNSLLGWMMMNDTLGDCTVAQAGHATGIWEANAKRPFVFPDSEIIPFYSAVSGYVLGDPTTDNGADEVTVMNYWRSHGLFRDGSHKLSAWSPVDAADELDIKTALWLFESISLCAELPDAWVAAMDGMESGFTWNIAGPPNPNNGHCFSACGFNAKGIIIETWGMWGLLTWAALAKYCVPAAGGAAYALLGKDALLTATAKTPGGYDYTQLAGYLPAV